MLIDLYPLRDAILKDNNIGNIVELTFLFLRSKVYVKSDLDFLKMTMSELCLKTICLLLFWMI
jgi:hypothetical protein